MRVAPVRPRRGDGRSATVVGVQDDAADEGCAPPNHRMRMQKVKRRKRRNSYSESDRSWRQATEKRERNGTVADHAMTRGVAEETDRRYPTSGEPNEMDKGRNMSDFASAPRHCVYVCDAGFSLVWLISLRAVSDWSNSNTKKPGVNPTHTNKRNDTREKTRKKENRETNGHC